MRQQTVNTAAAAGTSDRLRPGDRPSRNEERDLLRLEAVGGELVAVEVANVGRVGVGMPATRPDGAFVLAAELERGLVKRRDRRPVGCDKADGAAIGRARRLSVGRLQHKEFRRRLAPDRTIVSEIVQTLVAES